MLDDAVASFLDSVTERELDAPFIALLRAHGYSKIHRLHGQFEFGKDIIAQSGTPLTQYAFQTKAGNIGLPQWTQTRGQVDLLRINELAHPDYDVTLPREGVLVLTGRLVGGAPLEVQDYKRQVRERGEPGFDVWDRERMMELLTASPHVGLTGFSDGPLLELLGRITQGHVSEAQVERFSERWIGGTDGIEWRSLLEAAIVANRLRVADRIELACFTALAALRAVWASVHGMEPPPATALSQAAAAQAMFLNYAREVWERRSDELLDPKTLIRDDSGIFVTYPVQCFRVLEILGMYGLAMPEHAREVGEWLARFVSAQPGAAHPISDRWAVSLIPAALLIGQSAPGTLSPWLTDVIRCLGDRHDHGNAGLAGPHAEPLEEVEYLLGSSLEHIEHAPRRHSYLAAVLLDLAAVLEDDELYDLAYNEIAALDIRPFVTLARDDSSQYIATGHGIDVPVNTSPHYSEYWVEGDNWRMAAHHDDDLSRYYLGRVDALWHHLAVSIVTRDRHWVAAARALVSP